MKMNVFHPQYLFIISMMFYIFDTGTSIQCYSCDSISNVDCLDTFNETLFHPIECENENFVCVKREKLDREVNRTYLYRGCIQKHYCEILAKAADFCITCTTELCNSTDLVLPSLVILFMTLFFVASC